MIDRDAIRQRWQAFSPNADERMRRLWAASEVRAAGWGGLAAVSDITGLARSTINRGLKDIDAAPLAKGRVRREGGGAPRTTETNPGVLDALRRLVEPATLGDPMRALLWVSKSREKLSVALAEEGYKVSPNTVRRLLAELGYSRQVNRKADEGANHPDRNAQFEFINKTVVAARRAGQPVISVDTKKRELVGNFRNSGSDYRPKGDPLRVNVHDFPDEELGKVSPYGVYDIAANTGWVSLGITHDTATFAVASIRTWFHKIGRKRYRKARQITITADCGGSNGSRVRLWKVELQKLADETDLTIKVRHYPPGTSKWNKIEHRLFCYITQNWRGRPLTDHATIIDLIASTTTTAGLKVEAVLDTTTYEKGIKITKAEMKRLNIHGETFHPEWNYSVKPRSK